MFKFLQKKGKKNQMNLFEWWVSSLVEIESVEKYIKWNIWVTCLKSGRNIFWNIRNKHKLNVK